jgi:sodium/proline symporter
MTDPYALAAFVAYLLLVVAIGAWSSRFSSRGVREYFVGGRTLGRFVVALSAVVSGRSAWLLLGFTGLAYTRGLSAIWAVVGYIGVELLLFLFYAPRLRRFAGAHDCVTLTDVFTARFREDRGGLRALLVGILLLFMVPYVAAQFVAGGKALGTTFGMTETTGLLLTAGFVLLYTLLGGFLAVSLTDAVQGVVMLVALLLLPLLVVGDLGGAGEALSALRAVEGPFLDPVALTGGALIGFVGIGLGSPGNPHILVRYISIRDPAQLRWAAVVGTLWNVALAGGALLVGLLGRLEYPDAGLLPGGDPENVFPGLAAAHLHPLMVGMVIAAILAAIMSTADSQLLVAASSVVRDLYERWWRAGRAVPPRHLVLLSRLTVTLLVLLAIAMGLAASQLVFWLVLFAWAGLGAALGPTSILLLFWKGATRAGVMAGIVTGTVVTLVWYHTPALKGAMYELIPAFLLGLAVTVLVSLATAPPAGVEEDFRAMAGVDSDP